MNALISSEDFETTQRISKSLVASSFFQVNGSGDQGLAQAVVKVMAGRELGIPPVAAMMGVHVIKGRVSLSAQLMLACAIRVGASYEVIENEEWCQIEWSRDGKFIGKTSFSVQEANKAGLIKSDSNWVKYPADMLFWRAVARGVRRYFPDATSGMAVYAADEIEPESETDPETGEPTGKGSVKAQAEVLERRMIAAGEDAEKAKQTAQDFEAKNAPKPRKAKPEPKPEALEITDDDIPDFTPEPLRSTDFHEHGSTVLGFIRAKHEAKDPAGWLKRYDPAAKDLLLAEALDWAKESRR